MVMRLRAFSSLVAGRCATVVAASIEREVVRLSWSDGHVSRFHHEWLRDHCPQSVHPVSGQREVPLERLRSESLTLDDASLGEAPSGGQTLRLRWLAHQSSHMCNCWKRQDSIIIHCRRTIRSSSHRNRHL